MEDYPFEDMNNVRQIYRQLKKKSKSILPCPKLKVDKKDLFNKKFKDKYNSLKDNSNNYIKIMETAKKTLDNFWLEPLTNFEFPYGTEEKEYWLDRSF